MAAFAAPPLAAALTQPLLLPLLKQWQQRWQQGIATCNGETVAAAITMMILLCRCHCRSSYCCLPQPAEPTLPLLPPLLEQWE
jgi:hypothetical protein